MIQHYFLEWYEYILFAAMLITSLGIGVYFGFFDKKNKTNEEFLLGGRSMSILPVTMSLICTFISAVTFLGYPAEAYFHGTQFSMLILGSIPMTVVLAYLYVPVYFELKLSSAFQYFEWRFSHNFCLLLSLCSLLMQILHMPVMVWGPALAFEQVAGMSAKWSAAIIFIICIIYSSIGGLKAVLWTDTLQGVIMLGALVLAVAVGLAKVGFMEAWKIADATGRIEFFNMDIDPRTRHTFWTAFVGQPLVRLAIHAGMQVHIQRFNSLPTLKDARKCIMLDMIGLILVSLLCVILGMTMYAYYALCDPLISKVVKSSDQLVPLFVMDIFHSWPGISGVFMAGITCATMSSISSYLNASSAIVEHTARKQWQKLTEPQLVFISKVASLVSGLISFGLLYIVANVNDSIPLMPLGMIIFGCTNGPVFGAFTLGMFFPWVNNVGAMLGFLISLGLSWFVAIGNVIAGMQKRIPSQRLYLTDEGCNGWNSTESYPTNFTHDRVGWKHISEDDPLSLKVWSTTFVWQPVLAIISTIFLGLVFSSVINVVRRKSVVKVKRELFSKPILRFWTMCFGQEYMDKWVCGMKEELAVKNGLPLSSKA